MTRTGRDNIGAERPAFNFAKAGLLQRHWLSG